MNTLTVQGGASPARDPAPSPTGSAKQMVASYLERGTKMRAVAVRVVGENEDQLWMQRIKAIETEMLNVSEEDFINISQRDIGFLVKYSFSIIKSNMSLSRGGELDPETIRMLEENKEKTTNYAVHLISKKLSGGTTASLTKKELSQLSNKINAYALSLLKGRPFDEVLREMEHEENEDNQVGAFIASSDLADSILDLLTDPSDRLEVTFNSFCARQKPVSSVLTPAERQAAMEKELADLLLEDEKKAQRKVAKKAKERAPASSSSARDSASTDNVHANRASLSPSPLGIPGSTTAPSPSPSPVNTSVNNSSFSFGRSYADPNFDSHPGVRRVSFREDRRSASRQGYENFLKKILNDQALPVSPHNHVARWNRAQTLDEIRAYTDRSLKGGLRYAGMSDPQIVEQILHHDATSIDCLFQSELFKKHYTRSVNNRHYLLKVKLEPQGKSLPQEWTIATTALSEGQELAHFYCHHPEELRSIPSNAQKDSLISILFPAIEGINLHANGAAAAQASEARPARGQSSTAITAVPQENGPPLIKVLRQHPLTGPSTLWIAPIE